MLTEGTKSSEFWLSALTIVASTVALVVGAISEEAWQITVTGSVGSYAISRGLAKK